ncbi:MAG: hypothetical protein DCC75_03810 [Proteobacteria bacterium]|nr:MAG: hypothetical protein DCC75_03810 [Pseudomonadota bacterium]
MLLSEQNIRPATEYAAVQIATNLLLSSDDNRNNPTLTLIVEHIVECIERRKPVNLVFCCKAAAPEDNQNLLKLRKLLRSINYPAFLTIALDDLSDDGEKQGHSQDSRFKAFFDCEEIAIKRWSREFKSREIIEAKKRAADFSNWRTAAQTRIFETMLEFCFQPRGAGSGASPEKRALEELSTLAALYSLMAKKVRQLGAVAVWESCGVRPPLWPVFLSNYDGQGFVPSIILLETKHRR